MTTGNKTTAQFLRIRAGFTLLEVLISSTVMFILLMAVASAMMIGQRSIGSGAEMSDEVQQGHEAVSQIILDLSLATSFSERTDKAVTFTVPDRNNDASEETIRYVWSGVAGEALTRQYNGGAVVVIVESVFNLKFSYLIKASGSAVASVQLYGGPTALENTNIWPVATVQGV